MASDGLRGFLTADHADSRRWMAAVSIQARAIAYLLHKERRRLAVAQPATGPSHQQTAETSKASRCSRIAP